MANRRSNAIDRIVELAKAPNRGTLDQHSDETLFHLADLHEGAVRPSPPPPAARRRRSKIVRLAATLLVLTLSFGWAFTAQRDYADRLEAEAERARLQEKAEAEKVLLQEKADRAYAKIVRFAKAAQVILDMEELNKSEVHDEGWTKIAEWLAQLIAEAQEKE